MDMLKRIVGLFLILVGVVTAVHMIVEPLYHVSTEANPYSLFWNLLNPLMALAVVLGMVFATIRKRGVDREGSGAPITREFLAANTLFYGFLFVGILFFWNWFNFRSPAFTAVGVDATALVWAFIDAALPLLSAAMGLSLLRDGK